MTLRATLIALALVCAAAPAAADRVLIPLGQQGADVDKPRHGITKAQVVERFGEPSAQHGPVGEPPIYTWDYATFTVYFEGDRVIHTVVKREPG